MKKYIYSPHHQGLVLAPLMEKHKRMENYGKALFGDGLNLTEQEHYNAEEAYNSWLSSPPIYKVREEDIKDFLEPIDESQFEVRDCETCGGDGKETCTNPDHNFIDAMSFQDIGRIGCPVCGHDPKYKVPNGGNCEDCNGTGKVAIPKKKSNVPPLHSRTGAIEDKKDDLASDNATSTVPCVTHLYCNKSIERILCAAIWYKDIPLHRDFDNSILRPVNTMTGVVFCGYRHTHCMYTMIAVTGLRSVESEVGRNVQGFLTSKNRFVGRKEAAKIFTACGGNLNYSSTELYSEDLYLLNSDKNDKGIATQQASNQGGNAGIHK
jgi:hypothetical protein